MQPVRDRLPRVDGQRELIQMPPLPADRELPGSPVDVTQLHRGDLADPQALPRSHDLSSSRAWPGPIASGSGLADAADGTAPASDTGVNPARCR
jgi:hypothetical protein